MMGKLNCNKSKDLNTKNSRLVTHPEYFLKKMATVCNIVIRSRVFFSTNSNKTCFNVRNEYI